VSPSSPVDAAAAPSLGTDPPVLFSDRGCPYAHRVLALLDHLGRPVDLRESRVGHTPVGLERYSSSGRIPLLVHGELAITESRVMLEHLAEHYELADAYPTDLAVRTLHRHAMAVVDDFLAPRLARTLTDSDRARLDDALTALETVTALAAPRPSLLAFHVAPIWLRFRWWHPNGAVTRAIEARAPLCAWLDAAARLPGVARTAPEHAAHMVDLERARQMGLVPRERPDDDPEHEDQHCTVRHVSR
jgi:glutathione S-transferase